MQRRGYVVALLVIFGLLGIFHTTENARFQSVHGSDVVRLVGAGMCLGVALVIGFGKRFFPGD